VPTYEYACARCGERFEVVQRITDDPLTICQRCGAEGVRRVIFPVGIVFKGSGFHINDYGKAGSRSGSGDSTKSESSKTEKEPVASATGSDQ